MARYKDPVCRLCRREGTKLFLKGDRCYSEKCPMARKATPPGMHAVNRNAKMSEYATQLREKQKVRRYYGILEKQFAHYFELAEKMDGMTGANLLIICESRLDNAVYRMGLAESRAMARQFVKHGHFTVNGKKVDIPSFQVAPGMVIRVNDKSATGVEYFKALKEGTNKHIPEWIGMDFANLEGKVLRAPAREDIDLEVADHLIVELYSK